MERIGAKPNGSNHRVPHQDLSFVQRRASPRWIRLDHPFQVQSRVPESREDFRHVHRNTAEFLSQRPLSYFGKYLTNKRRNLAGQ